MSAAIDTTNLYETFFADMARGDIRPGERLGEESLASRWGVGRVPVREALLRLEQDGFVVRRPGSGTYVQQVDDREVLEIFDVRIGIEPIIAAEVARVATDEQVRELRRVAEASDILEGSGYQRESRDRAFHRMLCEISGLRHAPRIVRLSQLHMRCATVHRFMRLLGNYTICMPGHCPIVAAIEARDATLAGKVMAQHLRAARKAVATDQRRVRSLLEKSGESPFA